MPLGHRLRITQAIAAAGSLYGTGNFGDAIYGQRPSDTANLLSYIAVPLDFSDGIEARAGDAFPADVRFQVIAFGGPFEDNEGTILDLSDVKTAWLRAYPTDRNDLRDVGVYRAAIILIFKESNRRMTVPVHDQFTIKVSDA